MDATYIDLTVRLSLALLLGGAIGIEREYRAKEAGFRTHFLVALGSALSVWFRSMDSDLT